MTGTRKRGERTRAAASLLNYTEQRPVLCFVLRNLNVALRPPRCVLQDTTGAKKEPWRFHVGFMAVSQHHNTKPPATNKKLPAPPSSPPPSHARSPSSPAACSRCLCHGHRHRIHLWPRRHDPRLPKRPLLRPRRRVRHHRTLLCPLLRMSSRLRQLHSASNRAWPSLPRRRRRRGRAMWSRLPLLPHWSLLLSVRLLRHIHTVLCGVSWLPA